MAEEYRHASLKFLSVFHICSIIGNWFISTKGNNSLALDLITFALFRSCSHAQLFQKEGRRQIPAESHTHTYQFKHAVSCTLEK